MEIEEKRRRDDMAHEERMMRIMERMFSKAKSLPLYSTVKSTPMTITISCIIIILLHNTQGYTC